MGERDYYIDWSDPPKDHASKAPYVKLTMTAPSVKLGMVSLDDDA